MFLFQIGIFLRVHMYSRVRQPGVCQEMIHAAAMSNRCCCCCLQLSPGEEGRRGKVVCAASNSALFGLISVYVETKECFCWILQALSAFSRSTRAMFRHEEPCNKVMWQFCQKPWSLTLSEREVAQWYNATYHIGCPVEICGEAVELMF